MSGLKDLCEKVTGDRCGSFCFAFASLVEMNESLKLAWKSFFPFIVNKIIIVIENF